MALTKLQFTPGLNRETTGYANEGGWWDADKVRFRAGYPEKIGGWQKFNNAALLGTCRAIHPWVGLDNNQYLGLGTSRKYYVYGNGNYNDITPIREVAPASAVTVAAAYTTLSAGISAIVTTLPITSAALFPTSGGKIKIDSEEMSYAGVSGATLTGVIRGLNGTTPATHLSGAAVNCATLKITDSNNGVVLNDFVTFSGAVSLGGVITAAVLNQEYQVTSVLTASIFTVEARTVSSIASITTSTGIAPTYVYATSADSGNSGGSTGGSYQINTGLDTTVYGNGWGAGAWGVGGWGDPADTTTSGAQLRLWGHDNFGENLLFNVRDGGIYYWERDLAFPRAVALSSLSGANLTPTIAKQVIVGDNDRHVLVFGCDPEDDPGVQDPLLIRFSASESLTQWQTLSTSTAGSIRIGSGSTIVSAIETKQEIVVFTDTAVHSLKYIGAPYTFGINMLSDNISISGPNAAMSVGDAIYWMGEGEFYVYNGTVTQLPCKVKDYVFSNFNVAQSEKVTAGANPTFGEVWWFYPSANSETSDRYVVYNYQQDLWYFGSLSRSAWTHKNLGPYPIAAGLDNYIYSHEYGTDDGSANPPVGIEAYIESSGQDIGDGEQFMFIWRMIPDITFRNSTGTPAAVFTVKTSRFPGTDYDQVVNSSVVRTTSYPVEQFTEQLYTRLRGRSFAFRISSSLVGTAWRLGAPRLDIKTDGKR
jgi:hypothetical protein